MRNVTKTWLRMTLPLGIFDKIMLAVFAGLLAGSVAIWVTSPTWGNVWGIFTSMVTLALLWRWLWLEGFHRKFHQIIDMGADVGNCLHRYGDILISKQKGEYVITPLTHSRDT